MYAYVPNTLTMSRFLLAAAFVMAHAAGYRAIALGFLTIAFLTDWLDGFLARRWKATSPFGKELDPYADKAICWSVTIVVMTSDPLLALLYAPVAIVTGVYDGGLGVIRFRHRDKQIPTNAYAKVKTTLLMASLGCLYLSLVPGLPFAGSAYWVGVVLGWISLWYCLRSIAHYVRGYGWESYIPRPLNLL